MSRFRADLLDRAAPAVDALLQPFSWLAAMQMRLLRRLTPPRAPRNFNVLDRVGVYPLIDHFYDPLIRLDRLSRPLGAPRRISGLDLDRDAALARLLDVAAQPLAATPTAGAEPGYDPANTMFCPLDAQVLHGLVLRHRPQRIIEVGCGTSTLVIRMAIERLQADCQSGGAAYHCDHVCIEPYAAPWLERLPVRVLRQTAEACPPELIETLRADDMLFIDSSHMIRPQGDVLTEVLDWLGRLAPGVLVHIHDIYTPHDYPDELLRTHRFLWNEQYLVEAFLCFNAAFEVLIPVHHLWRDARPQLQALCPAQDAVGRTEPSSLWFQRRR
jgi:hypothetical protein